MRGSSLIRPLRGLVLHVTVANCVEASFQIDAMRRESLKRLTLGFGDIEIPDPVLLGR